MFKNINIFINFISLIFTKKLIGYFILFSFILHTNWLLANTLEKDEIKNYTALTEREIIEKDLKKLKNEATNGDIKSQIKLGEIYRRAFNHESLYNEQWKIDKNNFEAVKWFKLAAEQGDAEGQCELGYMFYAGLGVRQDYREALKWFRASAKQNYSWGQMQLAGMYEEGKGVPQNFSTAKEWYGKACDNGNQLGCENFRKLN